MDKTTTKTKKAQTSITAQKSRTVQTSAPRPIQDIPSPEPVTAVLPTHEAIARRAYEIYMENGCPQGQSEQIWRQAERDLHKQSLAVTLSK